MKKKPLSDTIEKISRLMIEWVPCGSQGETEEKARMTNNARWRGKHGI
jgi:hypothetical protein